MLLRLPAASCFLLGNQQTGNDVLAAAATSETLGILQCSEQISRGQLPACK